MAGQRLRVGVLPLVLLLPGLARAGVADDLLTARTALVAHDTKAAARALDSAEASAPLEGTVTSTTVVARLFYYRGVLAQLDGDKKGASLDMWRQTLLIDNGYQWEVEVLDADDPRSLFEALRAEVRGRPHTDATVPEATGAAQLFVDGGRVKAGAEVIQGMHLLQITCPDGSVHGKWADLEKDPKWLKMCPAGVDTSVVVADETPTGDDEFGDFGPVFGPVVEDATPPGPDPAAAAKAAAKAKADADAAAAVKAKAAADAAAAAKLKTDADAAAAAKLKAEAAAAVQAKAAADAAVAAKLKADADAAAAVKAKAAADAAAAAKLKADADAAAAVKAKADADAAAAVKAKADADAAAAVKAKADADAAAAAKLKADADAAAAVKAKAEADAAAAAKAKTDADAAAAVKAKAQADAAAAAKLKADADAAAAAKAKTDADAAAAVKAKAEADAAAAARLKSDADAAAAAKAKADADAAAAAKAEEQARQKAEAEARRKAEDDAKAAAKAQDRADASADSKDERAKDEHAKDDKGPTKAEVGGTTIGTSHSRRGINPVGGYLMAGGAAFLGGATAVYYAAFAPNYADLQDAQTHPEGVDRATADTLQSRHDATRFTVLALGSVGTAALIGGGITLFLDDDAPVLPWIGIGSAGIRGRF